VVCADDGVITPHILSMIFKKESIAYIAQISIICVEKNYCRERLYEKSSQEQN
jgi:hypothetical protein